MSPRASLDFSKYSGAGNDFLVVDERREPGLDDASAVARALCRRGVSVGADGVLLLTYSDLGSGSGAAARMRLWNADGSRAAFSGNAARCAVRYLVDEGLAEGRVRLATDIGPVEGRVDGRTTRVRVPGVATVVPGRRLRVEGRDLVGTYVLVGVPFFVLLHDDPDDLPVRFLGRAIRRHPDLQPAGANVDFVRVDDEQSLHFRVYERGVEDETLSSGTGSVSAALAAAAAERVSSPVACSARGGVLTVRYRRLTGAETAEHEESARERERTAARREADATEPAAADPAGPDSGTATEGSGPGGAPAAGAIADPASGTADAASGNDEGAEAGPEASVDPDREEEDAPPPRVPGLPVADSVARGEAAYFGDIEIEGDTRRLMIGTAFTDALQLS